MTRSGRTLGHYLAAYGTLFLGFGVVSPFMALFLSAKGLSPEAIGFALSLGTAARIFAGPVGGHLADRLHAPRGVLTACVAAAALIGWLYLPVHGTWMLMLVSTVHATVLAPIVPLADALAVASAQAGGFAYGWVRGAGSAAFILGTLAAGQAVGHAGVASIIWLNTGLTAAAAGWARRLPNQLRSGAGPAATAGSVRALLSIPLYRRIILTAALIQGSHALHDGFAVINWTRSGLGSAASSVLWSLSVAAEVVVFLFLGRALIERLTPAGACVLAAFGGVVRWGILAETASFWPSAFAESLHGLTFALQHLVCMRLLGRAVPGHLAGTAQAVYNTVAVGAVYAVLMLTSGWLYARFGAHAFWVMASLCAAAVPLALRLRTPAP